MIALASLGGLEMKAIKHAFSFIENLLSCLSLMICAVIASLENNKTTIFVKNLAWATTEDALKELFSGCKNVRLPKRPDGTHRG